MMEPPYAPQSQGIGGAPSTLPDVPICAVLLVLFIMGAATHFSIFKLNMKRGHKFILSMMTFGMATIV